jgi:hypothetical protein
MGRVQVRTIDRNGQGRCGRRLAAARRGIVLLLLAAAVAGCAYHSDGLIDDHYQRYKAQMPLAPHPHEHVELQSM